MRSLKEIKGALEEIKEIPRKEYNAEIVGIFGSYVRGEEKKTSDIDILVKFFEGATFFDLLGLADFLEEELNISVDIVPVDTIREEIKDNILKETVYI